MVFAEFVEPSASLGIVVFDIPAFFPADVQAPLALVDRVTRHGPSEGQILQTIVLVDRSLQVIQHFVFHSLQLFQPVVDLCQLIRILVQLVLLAFALGQLLQLRMEVPGLLERLLLLPYVLRQVVVLGELAIALGVVRLFASLSDVSLLLPVPFKGQHALVRVLQAFGLAFLSGLHFRINLGVNHILIFLLNYNARLELLNLFMFDYVPLVRLFSSN